LHQKSVRMIFENVDREDMVVVIEDRGSREGRN
jgi:hypothetical protein